jgi:hypothetical protein
MGVQLLPSSIAALFREHEVPQHFTLLKVDIDSWDCALIERLHAGGFRPRLIFMEVNICFPPPLRFSIPSNITAEAAAEHEPALWRNNHIFYGCSLASAADLLLPLGYVLVEMDGFDALWVEQESAAAFGALPRSLEEAFSKGFAEQAAALPQCFNEAFLPKVINAELAELASEASAAVANRDHAGLPDIEGRIREVVERSAPKHVSRGSSFPYMFSVSGVAEALMPVAAKPEQAGSQLRA